MTTGVFDLDTLNLSNRVTLDGSVASTLDFVGNGGADVNVDNVNNCITSGFFNTGTALGGLMIMIYGNRQNATVGDTISFGQGLNSPTITVQQPQAGRVVALTGTTSAAETIEWTIYINGSPTAMAISFVAESKKKTTGTISFNGGDRVWVQVTSGSAVYSKIAFFIIYD